jgi:Fe2+ or Zn2+ uptake regulation protein
MGKFIKYRFEIGGECRYNLAEEHFIPPITQAMATACKHPRVRVVSRHEDSEFVECLDCGEVFDSEEFRDMEIEETAETEEASGDL